MHDELINLLRRCGKQKCKNCEYEHVLGCVTKMNEKAADAIEELQAQLMYSNDAAKAIAEKVPKWIPVTERLPKLHEEVLVCNEEYGLSELGFTMVAVWDGTDWIETWDRRTAIHCVTHWIPLPKAPEEE